MLPAGWIPAVHRTAFPFTSLGFSFHTSLCFMSAFCFALYVSLGTRRSSLVNAALSARSGLPAKSSKQHQTFLRTQGWQQGRISPSGSPCPEAVPPAQPCLCPTCNAKSLFCERSHPAALSQHSAALSLVLWHLFALHNGWILSTFTYFPRNHSHQTQWVRITQNRTLPGKHEESSFKNTFQCRMTHITVLNHQKSANGHRVPRSYFEHARHAARYGRGGHIAGLGAAPVLKT